MPSKKGGKMDNQRLLEALNGLISSVALLANMLDPETKRAYAEKLEITAASMQAAGAPPDRKDLFVLRNIASLLLDDNINKDISRLLN